MPAKANLVGKKFNYLTVLREIPKEERRKSRNVEWECLCDCGNTTRVITNYLLTGHTKSSPRSFTRSLGQYTSRS